MNELRLTSGSKLLYKPEGEIIWKSWSWKKWLGEMLKQSHTVDAVDTNDSRCVNMYLQKSLVEWGIKTGWGGGSRSEMVGCRRKGTVLGGVNGTWGGGTGASRSLGVFSCSGSVHTAPGGCNGGKGGKIPVRVHITSVSKLRFFAKIFASL